MHTIGLIGGMSWESTLVYYRRINELVKQRLGGLHSAKILLHSVDFQEIEQLQCAGDWRSAGELLAHSARTLVNAGADCLLLCTNTMHKVAPAIEAAVSIPLLHIADATAVHVRRQGVRTVGLLGTRFTMEQDFYRERLQQRHGIAVLTPDDAERELVHRVIYDELCRGQVRDESRTAYCEIIQRLVARGAEGTVLGCTEITLLIGVQDSPVAIFDTAEIHAQSAVEFALRNRVGGYASP